MQGPKISCITHPGGRDTRHRRKHKQKTLANRHTGKGRAQTANDEDKNVLRACRRRPAAPRATKHLKFALAQGGDASHLNGCPPLFVCQFIAECFVHARWRAQTLGVSVHRQGGEANRGARVWRAGALARFHDLGVQRVQG